MPPVPAVHSGKGTPAVTEEVGTEEPDGGITAIRGGDPLTTGAAR